MGNLAMVLMYLMPVLHIGPADGNQFSWWLLGIATGFVLAVIATRTIWSKE